MADTGVDTLDEIFDRVLGGETEQPPPTPRPRRRFQYESGTLDEIFDRVLASPYEPPPPSPEPPVPPAPPPPAPGMLDRASQWLQEHPLPPGIGFEGFAPPPADIGPLGPESPPQRPGLPQFLKEFGRRTAGEITGGLRDIPASGRAIISPQSTTPERLMGVLQTVFALPRIVFSPLTAATEQAYDGAFEALPESVKNTTVNLPVVGETTVQAISESLGKPIAVNLAFIALGKMQIKSADMAKTTAMREILKKQGLIEPERGATPTTPPPGFDIPPRPEAGPIYPAGVPVSPKALPPAPAIAVTPEGQAIPRPEPKVVPMSAEEIAASRARIAPPVVPEPPQPIVSPQPKQTFKGKTYAERQANAAQVLEIPQSELKAEVRKLMTSKEAGTGDEALAIIAARKTPTSQPAAPSEEVAGRTGLSPDGQKLLDYLHGKSGLPEGFSIGKALLENGFSQEEIKHPNPKLVLDRFRKRAEGAERRTPSAPPQPINPQSASFSGEPPLKEGYVRLYRGEGPVSSESIWKDPRMQEYQGRWFTTNRETAEQFARDNAGPGRYLSYIDVPKSAYESSRAVRNPITKELSYGFEEETTVLSKELASKAIKLADVKKSAPLKIMEPAGQPAIQAPPKEPVQDWSVGEAHGVVGAVPPPASTPTWTDALGKGRKADIDKGRTAKLALAETKGVQDFNAKYKVGLTDPADIAMFNRLVTLENPTAKPGQFKNGKQVRHGGDAGLLQWSQDTRQRFGLPDAPTPQQEGKAFSSYFSVIRKTIAEVAPGLESDPATVALFWRRGQGGGQAVLKKARSTVGAAQYKPPPYEPAQLATGPITELPGELSTKVWTVDSLKPLGRQVEQLFNGELPNPDARFFRNVGAAIKRGDIVLPGQKQIMERHGLTAEQLGDNFMKTETTSGQHLNLLSQWKKKYNEFLRQNPEMAKELGVEPPKREPIGWFRKMDNTTRAMMTGRIATAIRNLWSGTGYYSLDAVDNAIANVATGVSKGNVGQEMAASMERLSAIGRSLSPAKQKELTRLLDAFPLEKMELISAPIQDVVLGGKFVNLVQIWNRSQEIFVRRLAFDASVKEGMARRGLKFDHTNPGSVPSDIIEQGVKDALRITMAAKPEKGTTIGALSSRIMRAYDALPVLSLINPFPRFQYANAFRFIWDHSPLGPIDLLTKGRLAKEVTSSGKPTLAALAAQKELANPKTAALAYAKAATGLGLFTAALAYRSSDDAPGKWYEVNAPSWMPVVGGKTVSGEAFAPFITYNLFAEGFRAAVDKVGTQEMKEMFNTIKKPPNVEMKDLARAAIGLNRIAGTGLVFVDLLQKGAGEQGWKNVLNFFGQYIGRMTVPLASYKNIIAGTVDPEEATLRDVQSDPLTGPIRRNVPILDKTLPASETPTRTGPRTIEHPLFGEFSGLSAQTYNDAEKELNKHGFSFREVLPSQGHPEADQAMARFMGPIVEYGIGALVQTKGYQGLSTSQQSAMLTEALKAVRSVTSDAAKKTLRPEVALELYLKSVPKHIRRLIVESPQYQELLKAVQP